MKILPDGATNRARNSDVVLQTAPAAAHRLGDELRHHGATLDPEAAVIVKNGVRGYVPNDEAANTFVGDEDVGAEPEDEIRNLSVAGGYDGMRQIIRGVGLIKEIGRTADLESRVGREQNVAPEGRTVELGSNALECCTVDRRC